MPIPSLAITPLQPQQLIHQLLLEFTQSYPQYIAPLLLFLFDVHTNTPMASRAQQILTQLPQSPLPLRLSPQSAQRIKDLTLLTPEAQQTVYQLSFYLHIDYTLHRVIFQTHVKGIDQPFTLGVNAPFFIDFFLCGAPFETPIDASALLFVHHQDRTEYLPESTLLNTPFSFFQYLCAQPFDVSQGLLYWDCIVCVLCIHKHIAHTKYLIQTLCERFSPSTIEHLTPRDFFSVIPHKRTHPIGLCLTHHKEYLISYFLPHFPLTVLDLQGNSLIDQIFMSHKYHLLPLLYHPQTVQQRLDQGHCYAQRALLINETNSARFLILTHPYSPEHLQFLERTAREQGHLSIALLCTHKRQSVLDQRSLEQYIKEPDLRLSSSDSIQKDQTDSSSTKRL